MPSVMPKSVLNEMIKHIAECSHMMTDMATGERVRFGTLSEQSLRTAALTAMTIATGDPVWPGDRVIEIPDQPKQVGQFRFVGKA